MDFFTEIYNTIYSFFEFISFSIKPEDEDIENKLDENYIGLIVRD